MSALADELGPAGFAPVAKGGPLVAVCGLCGGAGASTVAFLLAVASARAGGDAPVLAVDAGSATGGLSLCAGVESPRSLAETAWALEEGRLDEAPVFVRRDDALRLIAPGPRAAAVDAAGDALERIVEDARAAHGLTVVDCGVLAEPAQRVAAAMATHVVWVLPATPGGVLRARHVLGSGGPLPGGRPEVVVARRDATAERKAQTRELTTIADERRAPLVLLPHLPDLATGDVDAALAAAEVALEALSGALRR
ncbi:hypothetical protein [Conexibacter woesei]|uniref:hypothetical protein n=1 Tax=Conexibacter woesei TaxID=191495 RepID=UPI0004104C60|nr:hypothetical protein [Conexibacter woesei]